MPIARCRPLGGAAVGVYKPYPKAFQPAVDHLAMPAEAISFQSSNAWDAYASAFGIRVVWCARYGQPPERLPGNRIVRSSLEELPALIGA